MNKRLLSIVIGIMALLVPQVVGAQDVKIIGTTVNGVDSKSGGLKIASTVQVQQSKAAENQYLCAVMLNIGSKWTAPKNMDELSKLMQDYSNGAVMLPAANGKEQTQDVDVAIDFDLMKLKKQEKNMTSTDIYIQSYVFDAQSKKIVSMSEMATVDPNALKKEVKKNQEPKKSSNDMLNRMQAQFFGQMVYGLMTSEGQVGEDGKVQCPDCKGEGRHHHNLVRDMEECGKRDNNVCKTCNGTGRADPDVMHGLVGPAMKQLMDKQGITAEDIGNMLLEENQGKKKQSK